MSGCRTTHLGNCHAHLASHHTQQEGRKERYEWWRDTFMPLSTFEMVCSIHDHTDTNKSWSYKSLKHQPYDSAYYLCIHPASTADSAQHPSYACMSIKICDLIEATEKASKVFCRKSVPPATWVTNAWPREQCQKESESSTNNLCSNDFNDKECELWDKRGRLIPVNGPGDS